MSTFLNIDPALQATLQVLYQDRQAHYDKVICYRRYERGDQKANLNSDQQILLGGDPHYKLNVCPTVLSVKCDRLKITGLTALLEEIGPDGKTTNATGEALSELLMQWWDASDMEGQSNDLHYRASRDGDGYLIVDYDPDTQRPTFTNEPAFDGYEGVMMLYQNRQPVFAIKRWSELNPLKPTDEPIERLNRYYPNRIERYITLTKNNKDAGWVGYTGDGLPPVLWNTDTGTENGEPLGIPVFHLKNNAHGEDYGTSDLSPIVPAQQDALNVAAVSVIAAAQLAGFPVNYIFGMKARINQTTGQAESIATYPGAFILNEGNPNVTVTVGQFPAANLSQLIDEESNIKRSIALLTSTPLPMLNPTGQIQAEGTLQQQEAPLIAKCQNCQQDYGGAYVQALRYALRLEQVYAQTSQVPLTIDTNNVSITVLWQSPQTRNEQAEAQTMQIHLALGVPEAMIWRKLGYSQDEIAEMKRMKHVEALTDAVFMLKAKQNADTQALATMQQQLMEVTDDGQSDTPNP